jgi:hypothetical protein
MKRGGSSASGLGEELTAPHQKTPTCCEMVQSLGLGRILWNDLGNIRVLRRVFGTIRDEVAEAEEDYILRSFITCTLHRDM